MKISTFLCPDFPEDICLFIHPDTEALQNRVLLDGFFHQLSRDEFRHFSGFDLDFLSG